MDLILYNPLSRNGKNNHLVEKLEKLLLKENRQVETVNLLEITNIKAFVAKYQEAKRFIIIGGDGTLNRLVNEVRGIDLKPEIWLYRAGTGNDFVRSLKKKKGLIDIKKHLLNLPEVEFEDKKILMLNGVGLGLDGLVCYKVNNSRLKKNKLNYFRHALNAFKEFNPVVSRVIVNKQEIVTNKTWFISAMNSKYFGGGMKIAPKANRKKDNFELIIIEKVPKWLLMLIFPTIYLGWHVIFKKYVHIFSANEVEIYFTKPTIMQIDGETDYLKVESIKVKKNKWESI